MTRVEIPLRESLSEKKRRELELFRKLPYRRSILEVCTDPNTGIDFVRCGGSNRNQVIEALGDNYMGEYYYLKQGYGKNGAAKILVRQQVTRDKAELPAHTIAKIHRGLKGQKEVKAIHLFEETLLSLDERGLAIFEGIEEICSIVNEALMQSCNLVTVKSYQLVEILPDEKKVSFEALNTIDPELVQYLWKFVEARVTPSREFDEQYGPDNGSQIAKEISWFQLQEQTRMMIHNKEQRKLFLNTFTHLYIK